MSQHPKTTIRYKLTKNVCLVHLPLDNGRDAFPTGGAPIKRFYEEMTPLGPATKVEFDLEKIYELELLPELPETPESTGDKELDRALKQTAIQKALDNRAKNAEVRMWLSRYTAANTIQVLEETSA